MERKERYIEDYFRVNSRNEFNRGPSGTRGTVTVREFVDKIPKAKSFAWDEGVALTLKIAGRAKEFISANEQSTP